MPIAYADVFIENSSMATMSNEDGQFVLNIDTKSTKDSIRITHIGYSVFVLSVSDLQSLRNAIELAVSPKVLDQVVVRPNDPVAIFKEACEKIKSNNSKIPVVMKAFYREDGREDGRPVELFEALLDISYSAYDGQKPGWDIKVVKGRKSYTPDSLRKGFKYLPVSSVPDGMLFEDLVHKRQNFLIANYAANSNLRMSDIIDYDGMQVYVIEFDQKPGVQKSLFKGKVFIETASLAIVRVEYGLSPLGMDFNKFNRVQDSVADADEPHYNLEDFYVTLNYRRRSDSCWYLENIIGDYKFYVTMSAGKHREALESRLSIHGELLVTDLDTKHVARMKNDANRIGNDWIYNKITKYDPNYWQHINYIVPSARIIAVGDSLSATK
jgi:hypothetical protein